MSDKLINEIPNNIKLYLDEISEKLWKRNATIMVGAGFSKNASDEFPSWDELGDIFYEKIHGYKPDNKKYYIDILKLADEIEAAFGRPTLNDILINHIPDGKNSNLEFHEKLLSFPWKDVFTTNYDLLLEIASEKKDYNYKIILDKSNLIFSNPKHHLSSRIIKLNGSFPNKYPFIITEEDYRKYPKDFAPFVNTVQQALLENIFCLIGFSGSDPNFLKWIGWIRDNLGDNNSPKFT